MSFPQFLAGRVRRWHTFPALVGEDLVAAHSWHVASLLATYHPAPSLALLTEALFHDCGEYGVGDVAYPVKHAAPPAFREFLEAQEADARRRAYAAPVAITAQERLWLEDADKLSAGYFLVYEALSGNTYARNHFRVFAPDFRLEVFETLYEHLREILRTGDR